MKRLGRKGSPGREELALIGRITLSEGQNLIGSPRPGSQLSQIADFGTGNNADVFGTTALPYLASVADEVHLSPDGFVLLRGLARYGTYFKDALDKLGVKVHVFRVGEYKSFSEPFTRSDMSDEDRESSRDLLQGLWQVMRDDIAASRKLSPEAVDAHVNGIRDALAASAGDAAQAALAAGLVDRFSTRDEWRARLIERVGKDPDNDDIRRIGVGRYLALVGREADSADERIAVIVAQGTIVDGMEPSGVVAGDTFARLIRSVREDDSIKALVMRIDSPGGGAMSSRKPQALAM